MDSKESIKPNSAVYTSWFITNFDIVECLSDKQWRSALHRAAIWNSMATSWPLYQFLWIRLTSVILFILMDSEWPNEFCLSLHIDERFTITANWWIRRLDWLTAIVLTLNYTFDVEIANLWLIDLNNWSAIAKSFTDIFIWGNWW